MTFVGWFCCYTIERRTLLGEVPRNGPYLLGRTACRWPEEEECSSSSIHGTHYCTKLHPHSLGCTASQPTEFPIGGDDGHRDWAVLSLFPTRLVSDDHSACVRRRRNMHVHFPALRNQSLPRKTTPPRVVWCGAPKSLF